MLNELEQEFARVSVEMGLVSDDQIQEAIQIKEAMAGMGVKPKGLDLILREKDYISQEDARQVAGQVKASAGPKRRQIAGFEVVERLSQGAMGIVYKARQVSMDRIVALKVLSKELKRKPHHVQRFLREARAVARLTHKNIVGGIDVGVEGDIYYFAMEFVEGETLHKRIVRLGRIPEREALEITLQMAEALEAASGANILHRDIKPDNIMITTEGIAKLCDLGLARHHDTGETGLTQEGTSMGTPDYISPEQARGDSKLDVRTDLYSLGVTLLHMLTGRTPYEADNPMAVMTMHLTEPMPDPKDLGTEVSAECESIFRKMTQKEPDARYADATQLREDLQAFLAGQPLVHCKKRRRAAAGAASSPGHRSGVRAPRNTVRRQKSNMGVGLGIGAGVLLAIGMVVAVALGSGGDGGEPVANTSGNTSRGDRDPVGKGNPPSGTGGNGGQQDPTPRADEKAFEELEAFARDYPSEYLEIDSKAVAFIERHKQSERVPAAERIRTDTRARAESVARAQLSPISLEASRLRNEERFYEAIGRYDSFNPDLRFTDVWQKEARGAIDALWLQIETRFTDDKTRAATAVDEGLFSQAIAILQAVGRYADPPRVDEASRLIEGYKGRVADEMGVERQRFDEMVDRVLAGIQFEKWDFGGARRVVEGERPFLLEPMKSRYEGFLADLELLSRLPGITGTALDRLKGEIVVLNDIRYRIASIEQDRVNLTLADQRGEVAWNFWTLPQEWLFYEVLLVAESGIPADQVYRVLAIYLAWSTRRDLAAGKSSSARTSVARAFEVLAHLGSQGHDFDRWKPILEGLDVDIKEAEAADHYARAKREMATARRQPERRALWLSPIVHLRLLLSGRFAETKFVKGHLQELQELLSEAEQGRGGS